MAISFETLWTSFQFFTSLLLYYPFIGKYYHGIMLEAVFYFGKFWWYGANTIERCDMQKSIISTESPQKAKNVGRKRKML